ncbi:TetR/AcrR family transcriptional regulator [Nocardia sp. NPDC051756]|uniref:TetR/AcrR family transcriptional regulator n=1 Tax=Nocardia sp. NPDC051756 TaxID=3154751 RepID=UPI0034449A29
MVVRGRPRNFDRKIALERAMELFWERGYRGTTLTDLTTALGVNRPSMYAAFGNKEALFREAVTLYSDNLRIPVERALRGESTTRAAIAKTLHTYAEAFTEPGTPLGCLVVLSATDGPAHDDPLREFLTELRGSLQAGFRLRLQLAVREQEIPDTTNIATLAAYLGTVVFGMAIQARDGATYPDLIATADLAMTVFDTGCQHADRR